MYTPKVIFKDVFRAIGIIFMIVGVSFLAETVWLTYSASKFYANAVPAEGRIERISSKVIYVSYEADGEEMMSPLDFYDSAMRVGDSIKLYYSADDPNKIQTKESQLLILVFGIVGTAMLGIGAGLVVHSVRKKAEGKRLKEMGMCLNGEIVGIAVNRRISSNYRHPYVLQCQCTTPDGQMRLYQSGPIWYNPTKLLTSAYVPVYVDRNNFKKYYVDLSRVLPDYQE